MAGKTQRVGIAALKQEKPFEGGRTMGKGTPASRNLGTIVLAGVMCCAAAAAQAASIDIGSGAGAAGSPVSISVTLAAAGAQVAGTINDITFDNTKVTLPNTTSGNCSVTTTKSCTKDADCPTLPSPYTGNEPCVNITNAPDCTVNSAIGKGGFFSFINSGAGIRAVILGLTGSTAIPDGSVLYTCNFNIAAGLADGTSIPLTNGNQQAGDPNGVLVAGTTGNNGAITVGQGCCGDSNADGAISTGEATGAVLALVNRDVTKNPSADCNHDGAVSTGEATKVILNLVNRTCNP